MRSPVIRFLLLAAGLFLVCIVNAFFWKSKLPQELVMYNGYMLLSIIAFISVSIHIVLLRSTEGDGQVFVRKFMAATMAKFLLYLGLVIVFMLFTDESKKAVVLYFLLGYIPFTILEASSLYAQLRK
ncbi:MAG: hypothetical protein KIS94_09275 [Chitinophagales bacterium]|nr:hypothetical protein [Chitinophagales bacterium]